MPKCTNRPLVNWPNSVGMGSRPTCPQLAGPPNGNATDSSGDGDICATMGTLTDILDVLRRERARLFAKYGLKSMAVFGSATRDDFLPDSDVDIMVEFEKPIGMDFFDLQQDLARIVKREVDLVMRTAVKPHYMVFIEKDLKYV